MFLTLTDLMVGFRGTRVYLELRTRQAKYFDKLDFLKNCVKLF